ncbi:hypothetical protein JL720_3947 [Aureococcus anophagefferens]|nr:hypothetical protein JL720_3947 [Aureococcus anophagefferens]
MDFISTLVCAAAAPAPVDEGWYVVDARAPVVARPGGDATGAFLAAGERVFVVESEVAGAGAYARLFRGGWHRLAPGFLDGYDGPSGAGWYAAREATPVLASFLDEAAATGAIEPGDRVFVVLAKEVASGRRARLLGGGWCDQGALARLDDDPPEARPEGVATPLLAEDDGVGRGLVRRRRRPRRLRRRAPDGGRLKLIDGSEVDAAALRAVARSGDGAIARRRALRRAGRADREGVTVFTSGASAAASGKSGGGLGASAASRPPDRGRRRGPAHSSAPRPSMAPASVVVPPLGDDVEATMSEVLPSADPLDATDFDVVDYLNAQFPSERSIPRLDPFIKDVTLQIASLDDEISRAVHAQAEAGARGARHRGRAAMAELEGKSTITALKRMHMLTSAVDQLRLAAATAATGESAALLEAVGHLLEYFAPYGDVPRIADLNGEVAAIRASLETEVKAFVDRQLAPSATCFPGGGEPPRRRSGAAWIRRVLRSLEQTYGASLPRHWQVERRLVLGFVAATRRCSSRFCRRAARRAVAVVLKALQKSLVFEKEAQARFDERGRAVDEHAYESWPAGRPSRGGRGR